MDSDPMAPNTCVRTPPIPMLAIPNRKEFPGDLWSVLSEHKLQAMTEEPLKMREAWHEPQQPGTRRMKNAVTDVVSGKRECGIRRGGMEG